MATDSATASLPHALIWAYKNLCNTLQSEGRPRNFCATREAISGFVCQWRGIPAGQQELERRATFLVRSSGEGSPWKQAARNAVKFLRERKKIDDPSLEVAWIKAGLTTPKFLRYTVQTGVDFSTPLNDVIDALRWVLNRKRLSEKAQCALDEWRRQSVELYDQATAMQADGCRWLSLVYGDLRENPTKPSGALRTVELTPDSCFGMPDAAESLLHWAADDGKAAALAAAPTLLKREIMATNHPNNTHNAPYELPAACWALLEALDIIGIDDIRHGTVYVPISDLIRDKVYSAEAFVLCVSRNLVTSSENGGEEFLKLEYLGAVALAQHRLTAKAKVGKGNGGKPAAKRVKWKVAQSLMLTRLAEGTLPKSIHDAAKTIGKTFSTTRKAAHESDSLKTHFKLSMEDAKPSPGKLLEELTSQADARTKRYLENLPQERREEVEADLRAMPPDKRLELLKTIATSPDGGSCGDVSLYPDEPDPDSEGNNDND